jgi:hypothetical protein
VYAFIEKKECSKEEKTCGQNWEIAQISYPVSMLVFVVHLFRARILEEGADFAGCHPIAFAILMSSMYLPSQYTPFGVLPISLNPSFL